MTFWTAVAVICVVAITTEFVLRIVKTGAKHYENIERIKRGYPTIDGASPMNFTDPAPEDPADPFGRLQ